MAQNIGQNIHSVFSSQRMFLSSLRPCHTNLKNTLESQLDQIKEQGTLKLEKIVTSAQSSHIYSKTVNQLHPRSFINMCANNYLGWSDHPALISNAIKTIQARGAGLSSVRFICGTQDIHKELEEKIARFHKKKDAILYPSCFDANGGFFEALFNEQDMILSDELNHASIIDGIRLCKADKYRFKHLNMEDLENGLIKANQNGKRFKLIVTDGVFSMDGELAPLDLICKLADKYDAFIFVDECHATGLLGKSGRGTPEVFNVEDRIDFINSTFGKALGGAMGGYTVADSNSIQWLRQRSRPYLFSNSLPPAVVGIASKALDFLLDDSPKSEAFLSRDKLHHNTLYLRENLSKAGFQLKGSNYQHPIVPIMLFDAKIATSMAQALWENNIYAVAFSFPVVPKDKARIRLQVSAAHSREDLDRAMQTLINQGKLLKIIS